MPKGGGLFHATHGAAETGAKGGLMRHGLMFLFATAGILAGTAAIGAAAAETYRVPQAGSPALVADVPPGWQRQYTAPNELMITSADQWAVLEVSMIADPALAALPLPDVARQVFRNADLPRWGSSEPDSIGGHPGQAFIVTITRSGAPVGAARVILAKIDASHVARLTEIAVPKQTSPEDMAGLKEMISHLTVSGR